ncbi:hypothetical protein [Streptomyces sp. NBC_01174]|uniref:hypothetical protein n=1 Tax=Streptomyces sp. NBC_01174 TaxID=2903758 RepID=UPI002F90CE2C|nr:hypothetical protein OG414_41040 [Streptomyces sp. NBC_01174]
MSTKDFNDLFGAAASDLAAAQDVKAENVRPKYTAIREDQWADLDALARELMDARSRKGRRITSNSLIRVAIDALLAQRDQLVGDDETELRVNYLRTLGVQESGSQEQPDSESS